MTKRNGEDRKTASSVYSTDDKQEEQQRRYDTIRYKVRYSRLTCAQKMTDGQLNLTHGPETKK